MNYQHCSHIRSSYPWRLVSIVSLCLTIWAGTIQAQPATLEDGTLHIPVVVVDEQFYSARLRIITGTEPVEVVVTQATEIFSANLQDASYFGKGILSVPYIFFDGDSYWAEFISLEGDRFRVTASGLNDELGGDSLKSHSAWQRLSGEASDIGIGADGSAWVVGVDERDGGYGIYRWNGNGWDRQNGGAIRIAVDPNGDPWVVNSDHDIFRWVNDEWNRVPGDATDIGIGADGSVWVTGYDNEAEDYKIYRWNGDDWDRVSGRGTNIAVDGSGNPWVTNSDGKIYRLIGDEWQRLSGEGRDIGIGADGSVWIIGEKEVSGGYSVYQLNGEEWQRVEGSGVRIAVDNHGLPWVINGDGDIYRSR